MRHYLLAGLIAVSACGGSDDGGKHDVVDNGLSLSIDAQALTLAPGASQETTVHITRTGALVGQATVLVVSGAPDGVTISLDDSNPTADAVNLVFTAAADAPQASATITITGSQAGLSAVASTTLAVVGPGGTTIHATSYTFRGLRSSGARIEIWSKDATTGIVGVTGADGTVDIPGVVSPYDAVVGDLGSTVVYLGLTRPDPIVVVPTYHFADSTEAYVTVTLSGANAAYNHTAVVTCANATGDYVNDSADPLGIYLVGPVTEGETCKVQVVEHQPKADHLPTSFGYGEATFSMSLTTSPTVNVGITSYAGQGTSVQITVAGAVGADCFDVGQQYVYAGNRLEGLGEDDCIFSTPIAAAAAAPASGIDSRIYALGSGYFWSQPMTHDANQTITVPAPPTVTPIDGTQEVDHHTAFTYTPAVAGAISTFNFTYNDDGTPSAETDVTLSVYTASTSFSFNDLARLGINVARGSVPYRWGVSVLYNVPTVDAIATLAATNTYAADGESGYTYAGAGFITAQ